jgi:hypothetical protein
VSFNESHIIVGPPGCGKTTLAAALGRKHLAGGDNHVLFVHDPVQQFAKHGCQVYADAAAWRAAAAAAAAEQTPMPRGASLGGNDEDVLRLVLDIGERVNRADHVRVRMFFIRDEGSLGSSGPTHMARLDNEAMAIRRHRGIAFVFNLQDPNQLTERFYRQSTDVWLFRQTSDRAAKLDNLLLLERGELARAGVTRLPPHHYIHVRLGEGIVAEAA